MDLKDTLYNNSKLLAVTRLNCVNDIHKYEKKASAPGRSPRVRLINLECSPFLIVLCYVIIQKSMLQHFTPIPEVSTFYAKAFDEGPY